MVTFNVPQLPAESQTLIAAVPFADPKTVKVLPEMDVEAALELELLDTLYVPLPPETVMETLPPVAIEGLVWLKAIAPDAVPDCTVT
jgi:hypothetical protein